MERYNDLKQMLCRGIVAANLFFSPVQPEIQPQQDQDPIICTAEDTNQRFSVNLVSQYDEILSATFQAYSKIRYRLPNLDLSSELICTISEGLEKLPSPYLYIQNIIVFPFTYFEGEYVRNLLGDEQSWVVFLQARSFLGR